MSPIVLVLTWIPIVVATFSQYLGAKRDKTFIFLLDIVTLIGYMHQPIERLQ
jgi:hypothetical protein